jgi:hypothetical protein
LLNLNVNLGLIFIEIEEGVKNIKKILNKWRFILTKSLKERYSKQIISPEIWGKKVEFC